MAEIFGLVSKLTLELCSGLTSGIPSSRRLGFPGDGNRRPSWLQRDMKAVIWGSTEHPKRWFSGRLRLASPDRDRRELGETLGDECQAQDVAVLGRRSTRSPSRAGFRYLWIPRARIARPYCGRAIEECGTSSKHFAAIIRNISG